MTKRLLACSLLVAANSFLEVCVLGDPGDPPRSGYSGPRCIAGFCLDGKKSLLAIELASRYGRLATGGVYCYRVPEQNVYVRFDATHGEPAEIVEIFVSAKQNCLASFSETILPKARFPSFETAEGVRLGDAEEKVLSVYGPPTLVERGTGLELRGLEYEKALKSEPFGSRVLLYSAKGEELQSSAFYIDHGKVAAISLSAND